MNNKGKCPWWHVFFHSFRGEEYERVTVNKAGEEPVYTKWLLHHYCYACFKKITVNKLEKQ